MILRNCSLTQTEFKNNTWCSSFTQFSKVHVLGPGLTWNNCGKIGHFDKNEVSYCALLFNVVTWLLLATTECSWEKKIWQTSRFSSTVQSVASSYCQQAAGGRLSTTRCQLWQCLLWFSVSYFHLMYGFTFLLVTGLWENFKGLYYSSGLLFIIQSIRFMQTCSAYVSSCVLL